jgi:hypothetical protein
MMTDFVQQSAHERFRFHDVVALRGPHPEHDPRRAVGIVNAMQLAARVARTDGTHFEPDGRRFRPCA